MPEQRPRKRATPSKVQDNVRIAKVLFELNAKLEPRLTPLEPWFLGLSTTIDKWYKAEGNNGVKRAKSILQTGWLTLLGEKTEVLRFVKSKDGLPDLVAPLVKRIKSLKLVDHRLMSAVLSLIRVTDLWEGKQDEATIEDSLKVIQDSKLPTTAKPVIREFQEFLGSLLCGAYDHYPLVKSIKAGLKPPKAERPIKSAHGPNGPLMENAHLDVVSLRNSKVMVPSAKGFTLLDEIALLEKKLEPYIEGVTTSIPLAQFSDGELLKGARTKRTSKGFEVLVSDTPGKIALKPEKSGKLRMVAMPDYYTQVALEPLGNWLFDILRHTPMDCTFDQRSAIPKICAWQAEGDTVYSFDQSSCTDLFPVKMQLAFLAEALDPSLADSVGKVMTDRSWTLSYRGKTRKVRWSVGQPMGVYASWPLMAVTHHLLVQFASWRATSDKATWLPFEGYVICGDDIAIASVRVAGSYLKLVKDLGMKVNLAKSHISGGKTGVPPVSEFAKVLIWKARPLFEVKPKLVKAALCDWRLALPLFWELCNAEGWSLSRAKTIEFIRWLFPRHSRILLEVLDVPRCMGGIGQKGDQSLLKRVTDFVMNGGRLHPWLLYLGHRVRNELIRLQESRRLTSPKLYRRFRDDRAPSFNNLDPEVKRLHPLAENLMYNRRFKPEGRYRLQRLPSIEELEMAILEDRFTRAPGYSRGWADLLVGEVDRPEPLFFGVEADKELKDNVNIWSRVFGRKDPLSEEDWDLIIEACERSLAEWGESSISALELFAARQVGIIQEALTFLGSPDLVLNS